MPLIATRAPKLGNLLKMEYGVPHGFCRETGTVNIAGGADLVIGTLLGTVAGKYVAFDPTASDGSEVVSAIVIENKTVGDAVDTPVTVLVRGPAIVGRDAIVFPDGATAPQKAAAEAQIESLGILVRDQF